MKLILVGIPFSHFQPCNFLHKICPVAQVAMQIHPNSVPSANNGQMRRKTAL